MNNCSDWNVLETLSVTFPVTFPVDGFILSPIRYFDKCFFTKICFLFILFSLIVRFLCSFYMCQILLFLIFKIYYVIIDMAAKLLLFPIFAPKGFRNMTREQKQDFTRRTNKSNNHLADENSIWYHFRVKQSCFLI